MRAAFEGANLSQWCRRRHHAFQRELDTDFANQRQRL